MVETLGKDQGRHLLRHIGGMGQANDLEASG
jgi:hypothetical protein